MGSNPLFYVTNMWVTLTRMRHHGIPRQRTERIGARLDLYDTHDTFRDPRMHFDSLWT